MKQIFQSSTKKVKRSQINLNPLNPKRHQEENIKIQARNIKKVGLLGGIVLNEATHNLLDGHRRVLAMDSINKYDGTPETDYEIQVSVCNLDDKTEKEQMTYMAVGNTKADLDLISKYIGDIDTKDLGFTQAEIKAMEMFNVTEEDIFKAEDNKTPISTEVEEFFNFLPTATAPVKGSENLTPEEKKAIVKAGKERTQQDMVEFSEQQESSIILSFENLDNKVAFCEMCGIETTSKFVSGEQILSLLS